MKQLDHLILPPLADDKPDAVIIHADTTPSTEFTLSRCGGLSTKKFQPECVNEESSTERRSWSRQANRSFNHVKTKTWVNTD